MNQPRAVMPALAAMILACGAPLAAQAPSGPVANARLRLHLITMVQADQAARMEMVKQMKAHGSIAGISKTAATAMAKVDTSDLKAMKRIVRRYGWPTIPMVGRDGAHDAWLLVQHADKDPRFQMQCLGLMQRAFTHRGVDGIDVAYLTDRVRKAQHERQLYGTQATFHGGTIVLDPVEDPANLDKRRARLGMGTEAQYLKQMAQVYGLAVGSKAGVRTNGGTAGKKR
ncbi:MAG: hypothetical protein KGJ62_03140 [Armatimonadetes bacterium]|nr:hypothetical protein [Armatimonadota bacterium]MDE2207211.1 hypothetical protein [Armatimonadota bacterium]